MSLTPLQERRERVFLVLAAIFWGSMTLLNVIGITKFIHIGPLALAVGVLPYPLTFLCTDLISELFGKKRANMVVWVGLGLNVFVISVMYLGHLMPGVSPELQPPWQSLVFAKPVPLANGETLAEQGELFHLLYACTAGSVLASMVAYIAAQFCDVYLFHFWKRVTRGRHLWVRNNFSTLVSQAIDSFAVISITFGAMLFKGEMVLAAFLSLMGSNYLFKMVAALCDTLPFYVGVHYLSRWLKINPEEEHNF
ncbi:MAG: queuosine precursor transporter [Bdellovibrionaceae bacterium]|nr:queuosine precursor transporter [Bdellovibrionales bacterium]MCB9083141.1 queuosine precursor transporter [Pseudobdellovibrionaceae bacterium]